MTRQSLSESSTVRPSLHSSPEMQHRRRSTDFFKEFARPHWRFDVLRRNVSTVASIPTSPACLQGTPTVGNGRAQEAGVHGLCQRGHPGPMPAGPVMSDASPDPIRVWSQYAQVGSDHNAKTQPSAHQYCMEYSRSGGGQSSRSGDKAIWSSVHAEFARVVRPNLPGIGWLGVEQSFD